MEWCGLAESSVSPRCFVRLCASGLSVGRCESPASCVVVGSLREMDWRGREAERTGRNSQLKSNRDRAATPVPASPGSVCPACSQPWRCKSSDKQVASSRANRKVPTVREALKEAASEGAGRRTGTGYEATPIGTSGPRTAKFDRPSGRRRRSGDRALKGSELTWGDLASRLKGRRRASGGARSQQRS
jgi:hypothetical protein